MTTIGIKLISNWDKALKTTALDVEQYRSETSVKYPSFTPPKTPPANLAESVIAKSNSFNLTHRLSQAYNPIPLRHHYHHDNLEPSHTGMLPGQSAFQQQMGPNGPGRGNPQPPTPAPSPPPLPKPKKQQYQTDQNRPFLLPFSAKKGENATLVPFAIDEAERLFNKHLYVSLTLAQMWRTREDCMTFESGLERMPGMDDTYRSSTFLSNVRVSLLRVLMGTPWVGILRHLRVNLCPTLHRSTRKSRIQRGRRRLQPWNRTSASGEKEEKIWCVSSEWKKYMYAASLLLYKITEIRLRELSCRTLQVGYWFYWSYYSQRSQPIQMVFRILSHLGHLSFLPEYHRVRTSYKHSRSICG